MMMRKRKTTAVMEKRRTKPAQRWTTADFQQQQQSTKTSKPLASLKILAKFGLNHHCKYIAVLKKHLIMHYDIRSSVLTCVRDRPAQQSPDDEVPATAAGDSESKIIKKAVKRVQLTADAVEEHSKMQDDDDGPKSKSAAQEDDDKTVVENDNKISSEGQAITMKVRFVFCHALLALLV